MFKQNYFYKKKCLFGLKLQGIILKNQIINDVEQGNEPYGGYGPKANYVSYDGISYSRPLLISHEIHNFIKNRSLKKEATVIHSSVQ